MKIIITQNFAESSARVAGQVASLLQQKPTARLGLATGGSVEKVYAHLVEFYRQGKIDFTQASTINLDEYVGLATSCPQSYRYYMDHHLFGHINIDKANIYVPDGLAQAEGELARFQWQLEQAVDLQLLGVGVNGHIGFNEPKERLVANAHIEELATSTIEANARYFAAQSQVPRHAFTQGIGDILKARQIVLIATGAAKAQAIRQLLDNWEITTKYPVTLLKLHSDVTVVIDEALASEAKV